jgi:hypothetical protein
LCADRKAATDAKRSSTVATPFVAAASMFTSVI